MKLTFCTVGVLLLLGATTTQPSDASGQVELTPKQRWESLAPFFTPPAKYAGHRDLNELHALMAPRPFLVSGGDFDRPCRWIVLNHAIALYKFLGYENRIALTARQDHRPTVESNEQSYRFLEHFLNDEPPNA